MGALLALTSAVLYGLVDFAGGILSRRTHFATVTVLGQIGGLLLAAAAALLVPAEAVHRTDLLWGALSGVGSGAAMHFLNRGLSRGAMSVVVPVSAVTSVALSVLCGVLLLGDRPGALAWAGIAVTVPALWLVAGGGADGAAGGGVRDGLLASAGVAVQYLALGQAGTVSGLWPLAAGRVAAVAAVAVLLPGAVRRTRWPAPRLGVAALAVGAGAALGLALFQLAAQRELLAVAVVIASLYPALPVVLGLALLHERVTAGQAVGLVGAAAATVLLAVG
ncbi:EamA family transporter [Streptomyces aurantiogriseus]|uniref:Multidrug transporter n=1 Tax=Streptomyces aurantiogriseus TaxID=66870 RepID=A0A918F8U4_9ACTN|nr:EamA family transporter [Streptomyces aurantiogriseus]GGR11368.1 multidrug transporter [Streptomyces aurantiogriseus]